VIAPGTVRCALFVLLAVMAACSSEKPPRPHVEAKLPAPDSFRVAFETSKGRFVVQVDRKLAPRGADRFYELVVDGFFDENRFFRVVPGFVAQFGLSNDKEINERWDDKTIKDDSVRTSNTRGTLVYATEGPDRRAHQLFINLADKNSRLDRMGFAPIGRVVEGMSVVDSLYSGYGDQPNQHLIRSLGISYLRRMFPKLDYVRTATLVP
jgi:peptidyl-prolyl cis-trans isomerase A (cyclophilin A)